MPEGAMTRAANQGRVRKATASADVAAAARAARAGAPVTTPRQSQGGGGRRRPAATVARWPIDVEETVGQVWTRDASVALVRSMIDDYRTGLGDRAAEKWHDDIVWRCIGRGPLSGEWVGAEAIFDYHRLAERLSDGNFRQRLIALEGSFGSIVNAYLRTTASRSGRQLDMPSLVTFEINGGRVKRVLELPGDRDGWASFWSD
jgi:ketosteroid isomerase-like protein